MNEKQPVKETEVKPTQAPVAIKDTKGVVAAMLDLLLPSGNHKHAKGCSCGHKH